MRLKDFIIKLITPVDNILFFNSVLRKTKGTLLFTIIKVFLYNPLTYFYNIEIGYPAKIGKGFMAGHRNIVIRANVIIGDNVKMRQFSTIGTNFTKDFDKDGFTIIGDNVEIGCNVSIIGNVNIGSGCFIGAGAIITKDIPSNSTVVGVNKIIPKQEYDLGDKK